MASTMLSLVSAALPLQENHKGKMNLGSSDCSSFLRKEKRNPFMKTKSFGRINMAIAVNTSRFEGVTMAPPDPILGVSEAFRADNSEMKLNLGVGAYRTEELQPYVLNVVKKAENLMLERGENKEYLPIEGLAAFNKVTAELLFGAGNPVIEQQRVATVQGLSGTGSLRLAAALIERYFPGAKVLISSPTWGNHKNIFNDARVPWSEYRYYDPKTVGLDFDGMISDIKAAPEGSFVLLHGCAHNPTGIDPTPEQWEKIADVIQEKNHIPFFDVAYQGFASGSLDADASSVRLFAARGMELLVAQSYSKNLGLYAERIGAINVVCSSADAAARVKSQLKRIARPMYSNPPIHGARIVANVVGDPALFNEWKEEMELMAGRIKNVRQKLFDSLSAKDKCGKDWSFILKQIGMFSFTGLSKVQDLMTKRTFGKGHVSDGLYILDEWVPRPVACVSTASPVEAHCRLGHPSLPVLKKLCPQFDTLPSLDCESCHFAKHHRSSLGPRLNKRAESLFELVHSDVWGPCPVTSQTGFRYFVTFVDDFSRMTWIYFMKNRSEVFSHFCAFSAEIKTQYDVSVKILRSDNGKEYVSNSFQNYMSHNGILHQTSCVDTPSQNGVAERKNRHLLETARALMFQMKVPKQFWADAVSTACFLINRMPTVVLKGDIPYKVIHPQKSLFPLAPRIFGCTCYVRDTRPFVTKLDPKALQCVFLGYSRLQKGYRCFSPDLNKYLVSTDVVFSEDTSFFSSPTSSASEEDEEWLVYQVVNSKPTVGQSSVVDSDASLAPSGPVVHIPPAPAKPPIVQVYSRRPVTTDTCPAPAPSSSDPSSDLDLPISLRKGKRHCKSIYSIANFVSYDHLSSSSSVLVASIDSISVPKTVTEALNHPGWKNAMLEEICALEDNHTWKLVDLPQGKKVVGCKWVFAVKVNPDGSVARLKARLVARGYAQTYGVDYSDTFSPVAKLNSVRLFISIAASQQWMIHQLDIKNAFLHGDLEEEVYLEQPPGFVAQGEYGKVCRLKKALYGLKQSPRAWFGKFSKEIQAFGMNKSEKDHSVFYKKSAAGIILLVVYVDDIVITGNDHAGISDLKTFMHSKFHTKDLGELKYFLGIEVSRSKKGMFLSQRKYVLDLLKETGKIEAKPCTTPMVPNVQLMPDDGDPFYNPERYRRVVGKLNYLTVTRPDIAYAVSVVSQFTSAPTIKHWAALEQILCYLKKAPGLGILYSSQGHTRIECFSDADWAGSKFDRRSTTGYCVFFGGNLVAWKSKKQSVVSRSSAESEYRAMSQATCEIIWIHQLLCEVGMKCTMPAKLWCDNQAALHIAANPVYHERTKHIEVDCHFIREKIEENLVSTGYVKTGEQLGDIFTKALNGTRVEYFCNKLGMINIYAPA